jgi:hypothetical protein
MSVEAKRGCGFRKVGGLYLVCKGIGVPCDRLPIPLDVCPTCGHGIKQGRGFQWIDVNALVGGEHKDCVERNYVACPLCDEPEQMTKAGLLWIGEAFYATPSLFVQEARELGISRRIAKVPRDFKLGETWVLLAHPKTIRLPDCTECKHIASVHTEKQCGVGGCTCKKPNFYKPAVFQVFKPSAIEKIVTDEQAKDTEAMDALRKKGITPVVVPANDPDHQGTAYDKEQEELFEEENA